MLDTNKLYNEKYCKNIEFKEWRFKTIPKAMKILVNHFKPLSIIDVGCANGIHLKALKEIGIPRLFGIEGTVHWSKYIEKYFGDQYIISDLRQPISLGGKFDLVLSFEVLEHLEKEFSTQAVKNLCSFGNVVCCSACPISGGFHHLNPQPKEYWIEKFEKESFKFCGDEVDKLEEEFKKINCSGWFKTGLKVFRKDVR